MKAQWCCRELSTLNLHYLHTDSTNCGRQEDVTRTQRFIPLLSSVLFSSLFLLGWGLSRGQPTSGPPCGPVRAVLQIIYVPERIIVLIHLVFQAHFELEDTKRSRLSQLPHLDVWPSPRSDECAHLAREGCLHVMKGCLVLWKSLTAPYAIRGSCPVYTGERTTAHSQFYYYRLATLCHPQGEFNLSATSCACRLSATSASFKGSREFTINTWTSLGSCHSSSQAFLFITEEKRVRMVD